MASYCSMLQDAPPFWEVQIPLPGLQGQSATYQYAVYVMVGTYLVPCSNDCQWSLSSDVASINIQYGSGLLTVSFYTFVGELTVIYTASGVTGKFSGNVNITYLSPNIEAPQSITVTAISASCPNQPSPPPVVPSPNPSNNPSNNPPPPCFATPVSPPVPCLGAIPTGIQWRAPFYCNAPPTVMDPFFGEVIMIPCPPPLRCYKSLPLPDGSTWMWLGEPRHRSHLSSLAGKLFFATSWEYWKPLEFVSTVESQGTSVWQCGVGTGRLCGFDVEVTQEVWPNAE